jgi:hypothetical protein
LSPREQAWDEKMGTRGEGGVDRVGTESVSQMQRE